MQHVKTELDNYFDNNLQEFTVPIQSPGSSFQEAVWKALQEIPYGEMRSYAQVAERIGQPSAVRAVGRANGDNRIAIIIHGNMPPGSRFRRRTHRLRRRPVA